MSLKALMSRITHRGSHRSSKADRALTDARAEALTELARSADPAANPASWSRSRSSFRRWTAAGSAGRTLSRGVPLARSTVAWCSAGRYALAKFSTPPFGTQSLFNTTYPGNSFDPLPRP